MQPPCLPAIQTGPFGEEADKKQRAQNDVEEVLFGEDDTVLCCILRNLV